MNRRIIVLKLTYNDYVLRDRPFNRDNQLVVIILLIIPT